MCSFKLPERKMGLSSLFAFSKASCPQAYLGKKKHQKMMKKILDEINKALSKLGLYLSQHKI